MSKGSKQIENMTYAGEILGKVLDEVLSAVKVGVSEEELDAMAERLIREMGGEPGFQRVEDYKHATCISTNNVVVHGIPTERKLKEGDVIGIDCGVYYGGYHTDMAHTVKVGNKTSKDTTKFLETGERALWAGIRAALVGNRVGHISEAIQQIVEKEGGYSVVRNLVGHGVGKELHEDPEIPGYLNTDISKTPLLKPGMTIAVEVIYNMGSQEVVLEGNDNWTIVTEDGSLSGLFERTVLITKEGPKVLTSRKSDPIV